MNIELNQISRDWTILHDGRKFFVNFTESDGQTLALFNRDNWEVLEQTDEGIEELGIYVFKGDTLEERKKAEQNALLQEQLIRFCIDNWDNQFMQEIKDKMKEQKEIMELQ